MWPLQNFFTPFKGYLILCTCVNYNTVLRGKTDPKIRFSAISINIVLTIFQSNFQNLVINFKKKHFLIKIENLHKFLSFHYQMFNIFLDFSLIFNIFYAFCQILLNFQWSLTIIGQYCHVFQYFLLIFGEVFSLFTHFKQIFRQFSMIFNDFSFQLKLISPKFLTFFCDFWLIFRTCYPIFDDFQPTLS